MQSSLTRKEKVIIKEIINYKWLHIFFIDYKGFIYQQRGSEPEPESERKNKI